MSGATVTVTVIGDSIMRSAVRVARRWVGGGRRPPPRRRGVNSIPRSRPKTGRPARRRIGAPAASLGRRSQRGLRAPGTRKRRQSGSSRTPADTFIDLYVAPVSVPAIGAACWAKPDMTSCQPDSSPDSRRSGRRQRRLFVQGIGLRARRHLRSVQSCRATRASASATARNGALADVAAPGAPELARGGSVRVVPSRHHADLPALAAPAAGAADDRAADKAFLTFDSATNCPQISPAAAGPVRPAAAPAPAAPPKRSRGSAALAHDVARQGLDIGILWRRSPW